MVTRQDLNKPALVYVKETKTGKMVWRNFGYRIADILNNGNVLLVSNNNPDIYFDAKDVIAIDR